MGRANLSRCVALAALVVSFAVVSVKAHDGHEEESVDKSSNKWAFGYKFVDLTDEQKRERRELLEYYPYIAQLSAVAVLMMLQVSFALSWLMDQGLGYGRPGSPSLTKRRTANWAWLKKLRTNSEMRSWWMSKPVVRGWNLGTRREWIWGGLWLGWLLALSIVRTGNDYLHLTKRFGIIGASQMPLHYLLAMRSPYSPLQWCTRKSHEELKAAHQVLGRIVIFLFVLHAAFYLNFFIVAGFLAKRIKDKDVIWGIISIVLFSLISTTALGWVRRWNYRLFYTTHVVIAGLVIISLWFHVTHIRPFIYQTLAVAVINTVLRRLSIKKYTGTMKVIPGTNLLQVKIPIKPNMSTLKWKPGQHVYLSRSFEGFSTEINPFTVASIPEKDKELLLVARVLKGTTKKLADYAKYRQGEESGTNSSTTLFVEGPYGASTRLPDLSSFDKVLFVAGGVGATYTMPIYRSITQLSEPAPLQAGRPQIRFIWAVRKLAETNWAFTASGSGRREANAQAPKNVVEVFLTQKSGPDLRAVDAAEGEEEFELASEEEEDERLLSADEQVDKPQKGRVVRTGRPDIPSIMDEVFTNAGRVAVLVCGPKSLSEELSKSVEYYVKKGHYVYYHSETFGW